jgi:hypothetical protein
LLNISSQLQNKKRNDRRRKKNKEAILDREIIIGIKTEL